MDHHTKAILQALLEGETIQQRELYQTSYRDMTWDEVLSVLPFGHKTLRVKPKTVMLAGIEFPEPLRVAPAKGSGFWLVNPANFIMYDTWYGTDGNLRCLNHGLAQATKEGAELQLKAMILSVGGKP